jgi:hypothetical protein
MHNIMIVDRSSIIASSIAFNMSTILLVASTTLENGWEAAYYCRDSCYFIPFCTHHLLSKYLSHIFALFSLIIRLLAKQEAK